MFKGGNACENEAGLKTEGNLGIWGGKDSCSPWSQSKAFFIWEERVQYH